MRRFAWLRTCSRRCGSRQRVMHGVKALVFDVFGTLVDWRSSIAREARDILSIHGVTTDWEAFADAWRDQYQPAMEEVRTGRLPFSKLDMLHRRNLDAVLKASGLDRIDEPTRVRLNLAWHRLDAWPDVAAGLTRLRTKYRIAPCSNGNISLMVDLARRNGFPWDAILGAEVARDYKPKPAVYLGAAAAFDCAPEETMMVAAHSSDLAAAANAGLRTAFIARPNERGGAAAKAARAFRWTSARTASGISPTSWGAHERYGSEQQARRRAAGTCHGYSESARSHDAAGSPVARHDRSRRHQGPGCGRACRSRDPRRHLSRRRSRVRAASLRVGPPVLHRPYCGLPAGRYPLSRPRALAAGRALPHAPASGPPCRRGDAGADGQSLRAHPAGDSLPRHRLPQAPRRYRGHRGEVHGDPRRSQRRVCRGILRATRVIPMPISSRCRT